MPSAPAQADGPGTGTPYVVTLGDSYISGEAGRWAGSSNASSTRADALGPTAYYDNPSGTGETISRCHRSRGLANWTSSGAVDQTEWVNQIRTVSTCCSNSPYYIQESLHPNYWAHLATRSCVRQAYNGGSIRGGRCTISGTGLVGGEPRMLLR